MTAADGDDGKLSSTPFVATTVTVYRVPFVSPRITHDVDVVTHDCPPGAVYAVYELTGGPDRTLTAFHEADSAPLPATVAVTPVGVFTAGVAARAGEAATAMEDTNSATRAPTIRRIDRQRSTAKYETGASPLRRPFLFSGVV